MIELLGSRKSMSQWAVLFVSLACLGLSVGRAGQGGPTYRIYPLRNGICKIAGHHAFHGGNEAESYDFALYVWLILGGDKPILVDAGLSNVAEMNRGAAHVLRTPIAQDGSESTRAQLRKFGLAPEDIGHVFVTHLHFDHVDDLLRYPNAQARADIVLPSHDPGTADRWPPTHPNGAKYTIRAIKVGECRVRDYVAFQDSDSRDTSLFYLYVWVIEGGPRPIVVDTGPKYPEEFSKGTAQYIPGGIVQLPEERTPAALRRHGIDPCDVSHVIITHLHADHYDYFDAFPKARFVVSGREYEPSGRADHLAPDVRQALEARPDALQLVEDEEVVPGVRVFPLGCHTAGSQGVLVQTHMGPVVLAGDVVYKYENMETDRPTRSPDEDACREAMAKIRSLADIVLPAHDPLTLERWPGGIIGGRADAR